jgi:hypothetical protein
MKQQIRALIFMSLLSGSLFAQTNLVPNPSFETHSSCPTTLDQLSLASGWSSYCTSPDYYDSCGNGFVSVPSNSTGYQLAATGSAYTGFIAYDKNGFVREIIGRQLSQTLVVNQKYFISFKVSLAEFTPSFPQFIPCNKIGIKFSTVAFSTSSCAPVNNFAHVFTDSIIKDTLNWTSVKGSFIADSAYQYLMIGNFFDDSQTDTLDSPNGIKGYYFLDDVCVSTDSLQCANSNGVPELSSPNGFVIFPNPTSEELNISSPVPSESKVVLFDLLGNKTFEMTFRKYIEINVSRFNSGLYLISIWSQDKNFTKRIIINH